MTTEIQTSSDPSVSVLSELRELLPGRVYDAGAADALGLVNCFNTALQHRAPVVVSAATASDVATTVRIAGKRGVRVTAVGAGHGLLSAVTDGVIVLTRGLRSIEVDAERRIVRVGAGTVWSEVLEAAAPYGLAALAGSAPHVGVVGYLLGGGLGPVARTFGYAADYVREFELVTGIGERLVVNEHSHPDLFWALRGGKRGLGIVVAVTLELLPIATLHAGGLYFTDDAIPAAWEAWRGWTANLDTRMSTSAALLRLPPSEALPEPIRGRTVLHLRTAFVGPADDAEQLLAPLRAAAVPVMDSIAEIPYVALGSIHQDPQSPMPVSEGGVLLGSLPKEALEQLVGAVGPDASVPLAAVELRLLGGATQHAQRTPNAIAGRTAAYSLHIVGAPVPELLDSVIPQTIRSVFDAMAPWRSPEYQPNFVGPANEQSAAAQGWPPATADRLAAIRVGYDPFGVLG